MTEDALPDNRPQPDPDPMVGTRDWTCPQCREIVPGTFAVCWNCGSDPSGTPDPAFHSERPDLNGTEPVDVVSQPDDEVGRVESAHCISCGSARIVPDVRIFDRNEHTSLQLNVAVEGNPDAVLFKDRLFGTMTANVCGVCGYVQFRVQNAGRLYAHYRDSQQ